MRIPKNIFQHAIAAILHPACMLLVGLIFLVVVRRLENNRNYIDYVIAVTLLITAIAFAVTRRIAFSLYLAQFLILFQSIASIVKYRLKGLAFHAYDFFFTGSDPATVTFLLKLYGNLFAGAAVLLVLGLGICVSCSESRNLHGRHCRNGRWPS